MTTTIAGARVLLRQGERYRARAHIDKPAFLVSDSDIRQTLEDEGFSDVLVYRTLESLPSNWPTDQRSVAQGVADFTAFVEATWALDDATRTRPAGLVAIWVVSGTGGKVTLPEVTIYGEQAPGGSGKVTLPEVEIAGSSSPRSPGSLGSVLIAVAGLYGAAYGYRRAQWSGALMGSGLCAGAALLAAELVRIKRTTVTGGA